MGFKKLIIAIFIFALAIRLFFAFGVENFSHDAYFNLLHIRHIAENGVPMFYDDLSFEKGRLFFEPVFHYIVAFFSFFIGLETAAKILPNVFASMLVFVVYLFSKEISRSDEAAVLSAFISAFIPVFFRHTLNAVSIYSLSIPLMFYLLLLFLKLRHDQKYVKSFVMFTVVLAFVHSVSFVFVLVLGVYVLFLKAENIKIERLELEAVFFAGFFVLWSGFLLYKDALIQHGVMVIWQNTPQLILGQYFLKTTISEAVYSVGLVPFFCGLYVIYKGVWYENNKDVYLLSSVCLTAFVMLWLKFIEPYVGLMILGVALTILFSIFYRQFASYIQKTKIARFYWAVAALVFLLFILTSFLPSMAYAYDDKVFSITESDALVILKGLPGNVVLSSPGYGHAINYFAGKVNVADDEFMMINDPDQIVGDINDFYRSFYETDSIRILNKYDAEYFLFSQRISEEYDVEEPSFVKDRRCFELVHDGSLKIFKSLCKIEER